MIIVARNHRIKVGRRLFLLAASGGATALVLFLSGLGAVSVMIVLGALYPFVWLASKPLSRLIAGLGFSIRWKFEIVVAIISASFLVVSLVNYTAMDSMHQGLHEIKDMMASASPGGTGAVPDRSARVSSIRAIADLENKQHSYLFRLTPILGSLGVLVAAALGAAMEWSVIVPVRRMGDSMGRIGSGDFAEPVEVDNRDELGELAGQINDMTQELTRLQEEVLEEERAKALRERMTQVTMAEEEERRRISRELHDGLGPSLAAIGNRIRAAKHTVTTDPQETGKQLDEIAQSVKGHIQEIRGLIYDLRPLALDQLGLQGALRQQIERFGQESRVQAEFTMSGDVSMAPLAEVTVFRVVQECLTNVQDHSGASLVGVELKATAAGIDVRVEDNSRGFDPLNTPLSADGKGLGLFSMRERAEALDGSFTIQSSPGKGCAAVLHIPISEVAVGAGPSTAG